VKRTRERHLLGTITTWDDGVTVDVATGRTTT